MAIAIDHDKALAAMEACWSDSNTAQPLDQGIRSSIDALLDAPDVTFKYILVTGTLAKLCNAKAHPRALQASSSLEGAYDARSLCHNVIVGFEKDKGNLFGLSNEPFVNKPARHPEHDKSNPQIRNKIGSSHLHKVLEWVRVSEPEKVKSTLVYILRFAKEHAQKETVISQRHGTNLVSTVRFARQCLLESDGGSRLVAVWAAIQSLLCVDCEVRVLSPNAADTFTGAAGDVEVFYKNTLISVSECKQRPLTCDDVKHGIKKANRHSVSEYLFITTDGIKDGHAAEINAYINSVSGVDVTLFELNRDAGFIISLLNPMKREQFPTLVVSYLRQMRHFAPANNVAEIWNKISKGT
jgi:hypothetical protein